MSGHRPGSPTFSLVSMLARLPSSSVISFGRWSCSAISVRRKARAGAELGHAKSLFSVSVWRSEHILFGWMSTVEGPAP